ncbi:MAG: hypothetical protein ACRDLR_03855 [Gaiellaceae bacterium]
MTLTIALIVNAALVAGLVTALYLVMRIPFRLRQPIGTHPVSLPTSDERELSRAA